MIWTNKTGRLKTKNLQPELMMNQQLLLPHQFGCVTAMCLSLDYGDVNAITFIPRFWVGKCQFWYV
jgi:hypothetical protein